MYNEIVFRARLIAAMYFPQNTPMYITLVEKIIIAQNETIDEAGDLAHNIETGVYTTSKTITEAIRAMKVSQ